MPVTEEHAQLLLDCAGFFVCKNPSYSEAYLIFLTLYADYTNKGVSVKNCRVTLRLVGKRAENEPIGEVFKRQTENWSVSDNLANDRNL